MSDINQLKSAVLEQAHQEGKYRLEMARKKVNQQFREDKKRILTDSDSETSRQLKELNQKFQVESQQIKNQERQSTLVTKQTVLKELFQAALEKMEAFDVEEELYFLNLILKKYQDQDILVSLGEITSQKFSSQALAELIKQYPNASFNEKSIDKEAGFMISIGQVDQNYLYSNLVNSIFKEESSRIANAIFKEN